MEQILENLKKMLLQKNRDSQRLWDILSSLRGPDNEDVDLKQAVTGVIRWKLLGRTDKGKFGSFSNFHANGAIWEPDKEEYVLLRLKLADDFALTTEHFVWHSIKAFDALGLKWGELNK